MWAGGQGFGRIELPEAELRALAGAAEEAASRLRSQASTLDAHRMPGDAFGRAGTWVAGLVAHLQDAQASAVRREASRWEEMADACRATVQDFRRTDADVERRLDAGAARVDAVCVAGRTR